MKPRNKIRWTAASARRANAPFENLFRFETPTDRVLRFAEQHNRAANAARWKLCWLCRWAVLRGGGPFVVQLAAVIGRDTDQIYKMAQAAQLVLEIYAFLNRPGAADCQLAQFRTLRRTLSWSHFAAEAREVFIGRRELKTAISDLTTAAEEHSSVQSMMGHTSNRLSLVLPLWTAQTVTDYLARVNGSGAAVKFVLLEGPEWEGVEQVSVRQAKEK